MKEEWRDVVGYEGLYQVSNWGRIKSLSRIDARGHKRKEKILKVSINKYGYKVISLYKNSKEKKYFVHRLVAEAFIPNPDNLPEVNHIIDDYEHRSDNRVENLEWCTRDYNVNYGDRNKRQSKSMKGKFLGNKNPKSRKVRCITTDEVFDTIKEAGEKYNIAYQNICKCCRGKYKSAGKHPITKEKLVWEYVE